MVIYSENGDVAVVDGYRFRRDKKSGYFLSSKKINGKRRRLHVYMMESSLGSAIPKGFDVHHIDGNKNNNEIENLALMKSTSHQKEHGRNLTEEERKRRADFVRSITDKAKEWHQSEEGRKWHSEHSKNQMAQRKPKQYICTYCGKPFESINLYSPQKNKFCSNNCKCSYRRKSGVDDEKRICANCGKEFDANKYTKIKYCKECWNSEHRVHRNRGCV